MRKQINEFYTKLADILTPRQIEVFEQVVQGLSNKEVGEELAIQTSAVKFHLTNILKRLDMPSRCVMIVWYFESLISKLKNKDKEKDEILQ